MMKFLNISCKKATFLISKKQETKLSLKESIGLRLHLGICGFCNLFQKQTLFIGKNAKHVHSHSHAESMSQTSKEKIINALKEI
jgi:hypothetical protein